MPTPLSVRPFPRATARRSSRSPRSALPWLPGGRDLKPKAAASALPFGGGAGCGVKIVPVAFLVLQGERVRMLPITEPATSTADRLIEQIPELVDRINEMISQYRAEKKVDVDLA